jgi:hypothetical protein
VFQPHGVVLDDAHAVADKLGLPRWWLNEQASAYVAPGGDAAAPRVFDHPGMRVSAASPEHSLAMKVLAARRRDAEDIRFLVEHLRLIGPDEVLALCAEIVPEEEVPGRLVWYSMTCLAISDLLIDHPSVLVTCSNATVEDHRRWSRCGSHGDASGPPTARELGKREARWAVREPPSQGAP